MPAKASSKSKRLLSHPRIMWNSWKSHRRRSHATWQKNVQKKRIQLEEREIRVSTTDPDSGYMVRDGKPEGFFYLDHRTVDGKYNFITDVYVTPGNIHDSVPYLERLDRQINRFGFQVEEVALD